MNQSKLLREIASKIDDIKNNSSEYKSIVIRELDAIKFVEAAVRDEFPDQLTLSETLMVLGVTFNNYAKEHKEIWYGLFLSKSLNDKQLSRNTINEFRSIIDCYSEMTNAAMTALSKQEQLY